MFKAIRRTTLNFIIDAIGFAGFAFLTATGVLVRYVLPPGSGHHTTLWGLDRHEWGALHFWIAIGFLCVLALHLFTHWRWILCVMQGQPSDESGVRLALGLIGILAVLAVAIAPFVSSVERTSNITSQRSESSALTHESEFVRGRMTLSEIEQRTGVPAAYIIERLDMPTDVLRDVGIAKLGKSFNFDIDDVRRIVSEYKATK